MNDLRALTLHRPWDVAMLRGTKQIENRSWVPPPAMLGQWILIHTGRLTRDARVDPFISSLWPGFKTADRFEQGFIVGAMRLRGCIIEKYQPKTASWFSAQDGWRHRVIEAADRANRGEEPWFFGIGHIFAPKTSCGWIFDQQVIVFDRPVPQKGFQKLWRPTPAASADCTKQIEEKEASQR